MQDAFKTLSRARLSLLGAVASGIPGDVWHVFGHVLRVLEIDAAAVTPTGLAWFLDHDPGDTFCLYAYTRTQLAMNECGVVGVECEHEFAGLTMLEVEQIGKALLDAAERMPLGWLPSMEVASLVEETLRQVRGGKEAA